MHIELVYCQSSCHPRRHFMKLGPSDKNASGMNNVWFAEVPSRSSQLLLTQRLAHPLRFSLKPNLSMSWRLPSWKRCRYCIKSSPERFAAVQAENRQQSPTSSYHKPHNRVEVSGPLCRMGRFALWPASLRLGDWSNQTDISKLWKIVLAKIPLTLNSFELICFRTETPLTIVSSAPSNFPTPLIDTALSSHPIPAPMLAFLVPARLLAYLLFLTTGLVACMELSSFLLEGTGIGLRASTLR